MDGKTVCQWDCADPADCSNLPHNFIKEGQKFMLFWRVTDLKETFGLKVNNLDLSSYVYLDSSFKLEDEQV